MAHPPARRQRRSPGVMSQLKPAWLAELERKVEPPVCRLHEIDYDVAAALRTVAAGLLQLAEAFDRKGG